MRRLGTGLLLLIIFIAGVFLGGSLGVLGKRNVVYLQENPGVIPILPLLSKGDTVYWVDPHKPLDAKGKLALDTSIDVGANGPCEKSPLGTGVCKINVTKGNYPYLCGEHCGDPTIPVDSSTVPYMETRFTGGNSDGALSALYLSLAQLFVADFFSPGSPVVEPKPTPPPVRLFTANPPSTIASVQCANRTLTVADPSGWVPPAQFPLSNKMELQWQYVGSFTSPFTVQDVPGSTALGQACGLPGAASFSSGATGVTLSCTLKSGPAKQEVDYDVIDQTGSCTMTPNTHQHLEVAAATPVIPQAPR